jgi:hypothetical protein
MSQQQRVHKNEMTTLFLLIFHFVEGQMSFRSGRHPLLLSPIRNDEFVTGLDIYYEIVEN